MIGTIFASLLALGGLIVLISAGRQKDAQVRGGGRLIALGLLVLSVLVFGFKMTYYVSATDVAVPVTLGNVGTAVGPGGGLHFKSPITSIETFPARPLTLPEDITVSSRTSQGGSITARYSARWQVDPENAHKTYLQVRTGDDDVISKTIVEKNLATAIGNAYVKYDNATATTARIQAETDVLNEVNRLLESYGVKVTQVYLRQVDPDAKTSDSLNRASAAINETVIAKQHVETAKQEAIAAEELAKGAQKSTAQIPGNLTPQQVTLYCAQLWAQAQQDATAKGTTLWTTPCSAGSGVTPIVNAK